MSSWVTSGILVSSAPADNDRRPPTVFLSYASEDRKAARRLGDSLPAYGLEVWYDESELGGGDAWDQKIRQQIRDPRRKPELLGEGSRDGSNGSGP